MTGSPADKVNEYHRKTKHHRMKLAPSLGYMDWSNQPDPFRSFTGSPVVPLSLHSFKPKGSSSSLYKPPVETQPLTLNRLSSFLELSMGLSAWKEWGQNRWSLRMHPSSGNLHPTECYIVNGTVQGLEPGVFHYRVFDHGLEKRVVLKDEFQGCLSEVFGEFFLVGLSSIYWRESWKYGERAYRYCHLDLGHILAQLNFVGRLHGWKVQMIHGLSTRAMGNLLGVWSTNWPEGEKECPDIVCLVQPWGKESTANVDEKRMEEASNSEVLGKPNQLSVRPMVWPLIQSVQDAAEKPPTHGFKKTDWDQSLPVWCPDVKSAEWVLRNRRSAVAFDPNSDSMPFEVFLNILDKTRCRMHLAPFDMGLGSTRIDLFIFVHHVENITQGLYCLVRKPNHLDRLKEQTDSNFLWERVSRSSVSDLDQPASLYLLEHGDFRSVAKSLSCQQDIAGDSCFSLGMIAQFKGLEARPWLYPRLFWEAGAVGQVLYEESEARGFRGTGIGCFFDDDVHHLLGISTEQCQSVYHFSVGVPVEDSRLGSLPPYGHLPGHRWG